MKFLFVIVVLSFIAIACCQTRPNIPETYEGHGTFFGNSRQGRFRGRYSDVRDFVSGKALLRFEIFDPDTRSMDLARWDLHENYIIHESNCQGRPLNGSMPAAWSWTAKARYAGMIPFEREMLNLWEFTENRQYLNVGVRKNTPNIPVLFTRNVTEGDLVVTFQSFETRPPHENWFHVPSQCKN